MTDVFISYSRRDKAFVQVLNQALEWEYKQQHSDLLLRSDEFVIAENRLVGTGLLRGD
jgi:hypothetical protein